MPYRELKLTIKYCKSKSTDDYDVGDDDGDNDDNGGCFIVLSAGLEENIERT